MSGHKHVFLEVPLEIDGELLGKLTICSECFLTQTEIEQADAMLELMKQGADLRAKLEATEDRNRKIIDLNERILNTGIAAIDSYLKLEQDNEITPAQYASLGKALLEVFQSAERQSLDCPIIKLIEDCEECPFGKACDLIIEMERPDQAQSAGQPQKEVASYPQMDAKTVMEFLAICEEPLALETRQMLINLIQSLSHEAVIGMAAVEAFDKLDRYLDSSTNLTIPCGFNSPIRRDWFNEGEFHPKLCHKCGWHKFCRLRVGKEAKDE